MPILGPMSDTRQQTPVLDVERGPLLALLLGAIFISFAPIFVKMIDQALLGPTAIAFWRTLIGSGALFLLARLMGRPLTLPRPIFRFTLLAGFIFFIDLFVWHRSIIYAGAGMATILGNTQVFATAVLSFLFFKEKLTGRFFIAAITGFIGVVLLVGVGSELHFTTTYIQGIIYGLLTGVAYANYLLTVRMAGARHSRPEPVTFMAWTSLFSAVFLFPASLITEPDRIWPGTHPDMLWVVALALVAQAGGWIIISRSLPRLPGATGGLVLLLQPVLATIWGVYLLNEELLPLQLLGAAITLGAIYLGTRRRSRLNKPPA
ncbi:EamA family transporter [candidate division GN15 bacterium]|nr:EamA family transporter [candidate division GN15 bacterium]